ncbi:hypothetical protein [Streptomyces sp. NPDC048473]
MEMRDETLGGGFNLVTGAQGAGTRAAPSPERFGNGESGRHCVPK